MLKTFEQFEQFEQQFEQANIGAPLIATLGYLWLFLYGMKQTCQPPKHANLEMLKKSPEKPGDWDLKPGVFQNMC